MIILKLFYILIIIINLIHANESPIIGILTQPSYGKNEKFGYQFILANYIKYVEMAGGRVVPILFDKNKDELIDLFNQLNGILLPGGGVDYETKYKSTLYTIWDYVIDRNSKNDYFPLHGTCLGFEEIVQVASNNFNDTLSKFNSTNYSIPLNFTKNSKHSKLFKHCPSNIIHSLSNEPITYNYHSWGISSKDFYDNPKLNKMFNVLSKNNDKNGKEFISSIESKHYPIYAIMWHPEKAAHTWNKKYNINHSYNSILSSQYLSNFFINECRKSNHSFIDNNLLLASLIFNYSPIYTYKDTNIEQTYYFNKSK